MDRLTSLAVTEGLRRGWEIHDESHPDTLVGRILTLMDDLPLAERFDKTRLAASNAELVRRVSELCGDYGRHAATPTEARALLKLDKLVSV